MKGNMQIKLTHAQASQPNFTQAVQRLANTPMNLKMAYNFKKILDKVIQLKRDMAKEYEDTLIHPFAKKDENGKLVMNEAMEGFEILEDKKEAFNAAEKIFSEIEVSLGREKISLAFLANLGIQMTPTDLKALEPLFIDDMEMPDEERPHLTSA